MKLLIELNAQVLANLLMLLIEAVANLLEFLRKLCESLVIFGFDDNIVSASLEFFKVDRFFDHLDVSLQARILVLRDGQMRPCHDM